MAPILEKLQKLMTHEKSARSVGNIREAAAFKTKIDKLLIEHNLTEEQVCKQAGASDVITIEVLPTEWMEDKSRAESWLRQKNMQLWCFRMSSVIAEVNKCRCLIYPAPCKFAFVGMKSSVESAVETFKYLASLDWELATKEREKYRTLLTMAAQTPIPKGTMSHTMWAFRDSFLEGFSEVVSGRLKAKKYNEDQRTDSKRLYEVRKAKNENALVVVDNIPAKLDEHLEENSTSVAAEDIKIKDYPELLYGLRKGRELGAAVSLTKVEKIG